VRVAPQRRLFDFDGRCGCGDVVRSRRLGVEQRLGIGLQRQRRVERQLRKLQRTVQFGRQRQLELERRLRFER
jgi:hypothetical protein